MAGKRKGAHPRFALTDLKVRRLKEPGFYADGNCLFLRIDPSGARRWVMRLVIQGKRKDAGLGSADLVTLEEARDQARAIRKAARAGGDPLAERKAKQRAKTPPTFAEVARELIESRSAEWRNEKHRKQWLSTLEDHAFETLGKMPVNLIETDDVMAVLKPIWETKTETATRLRTRVQAVLDRAKVLGYRTGDNPARWGGHLDHLLPKPSKVKKVKHFAALDWRKLPAFMAELPADDAAARALHFTILTVARSGETRGMTWGEVDLGECVWTIPAERHKTGREHRVPLTAAAIAVLGPAPEKADALVFERKKGGALSDKQLLAPLNRLPGGRPLDKHGKGVTPHGFRACFKTWAEDATAHPKGVIEAALSHGKDKLEAAYNRGDLFVKRQRLMEDWANYATREPSTVTVLQPKDSAAALHA